MLQTATDAAELTVAETVRHFAKYYPNPRDPEEVIDQVGLTAKAGSRVKSLSGGQRRRVDVALGIVGRPELLFLDEPTTGFDPEARRQFWALIDGLAHEGTTILLTTHYLDEVEALADRLAVLARGSVVAEGPRRPSPVANAPRRSCAGRTHAAVTRNARSFRRNSSPSSPPTTGNSPASPSRAPAWKTSIST